MTALLPPITKGEPHGYVKKCSTQLFAASLQGNDAYVRYKLKYSTILDDQAYDQVRLNSDYKNYNKDNQKAARKGAALPLNDEHQGEGGTLVFVAVYITTSHLRWQGF